MSKKFVALARVSSREQEREGFSLEVQEDALRKWAKLHDGIIVKLFRIAETASKKDERKAFKELLAYARHHADEIDGVLFYKVDRAARNLFDYVELERLEADHGVGVNYITQPTENTPSGRMMRRTLANMAAFFTEQQSLDVKDGLARRVQNGLFISRAPYGYSNIRREGRGLIETDLIDGPKVKRAFDLYAYQGHTLDSLIDQLEHEGVPYSEQVLRFPRSKLHSILRDRAYVGDVNFHGEWYPGSHQPLVDRPTFDRVQALLGALVYRAHELTYAGELVACGHCGHPITGERKTKQTNLGPRDYVYYRCAKYNKPGHPRDRVTEADIDRQMHAAMKRIRIEDEDVRDWFLQVLRARTRQVQHDTGERVADLQRQLTSLRGQQDRLLNLRLLDEIEQGTFATKSTELRDRIANLNLQLEGCDRTRAERGEIAEKVFELSQTLAEKWLTADYRAKRQILEMTCLNLTLNGASVVATMKRPFDVLVEGLFSAKSRGGGI
jgi:site-specific DNA recombinase